MQNNEGSSPLMDSCRLGDIPHCRLLISHGADVDLQDQNGITALMLAIVTNHVSVAFILIDYGADTSIITVEGSSALTLASQRNQISVVEKIIGSFHSSTNKIINLRDGSGETSLMIASSRGHTEIVNLLLEAGAQVNFSNLSDYSSLHLPPHQIKLHYNQGTIRGTALDIAVISGNVEIVSLLLQYGAKVHNIYYLLKSIILKQAEASHKKGTNSFRQMLTGIGTDVVDTVWEKYYIIILLLFSHDSDLIRRVQCAKPSALYMYSLCFWSSRNGLTFDRTWNGCQRSLQNG